MQLDKVALKIQFFNYFFIVTEFLKSWTYIYLSLAPNHPLFRESATPTNLPMLIKHPRKIVHHLFFLVFPMVPVERYANDAGAGEDAVTFLIKGGLMLAGIAYEVYKEISVPVLDQ